MQKAKILFITAPIGAGHTRAAQAVQQALDKLYPDFETRLVNVFDFFNPFIGRAIFRAYLAILGIFPSLYGTMYEWGNNSVLALKGREGINRYLAGKMQKFITDYHPDAIVCTHATPAGLVAYLRREGTITLPVFAVITDFVVHRLWVYPELDFYYIAHTSSQDYLEDNGIVQSRSLVSGIPVDDTFATVQVKNVTVLSLDLRPDQPVILVMGGGAGLLPMEEIVDVCSQLRCPVQVVVVTGHNQKLYSRLTNKYKHESSIHILGFVNNIAELMASSSLIISKPGGMTSAEALCAGLAMVIYRPIPGQEEANSRYLTAQQVAWQVSSAAELSVALTLLLGEGQSHLEKGRQQALAISKPQAAATIAHHMIKFIQSGQDRS